MCSVPFRKMNLTSKQCTSSLQTISVEIFSRQVLSLSSKSSLRDKGTSFQAVVVRKNVTFQSIFFSQAHVNGKSFIPILCFVNCSFKSLCPFIDELPPHFKIILETDLATVFTIFNFNSHRWQCCGAKPASSRYDRT